MSESTAGFSTMSSSIAFAHNYNQWVLDWFKPYIGKRLLEVGTGQGNYAGYLKHLEEYVSVDLDEEIIARAKKENSFGKYFVCDVTSPNLKKIIDEHSLDTILCLNVVEHIKDDKKAVLNMYESLPANGHLLILVPAFQSLYSSMDQLAGHFKRYRLEDLQRLDPVMTKNCQKYAYFNPIGGVGWWFNKFRTYKTLDDDAINAQIKVFDKYIVPISKILNPVTSSFFGQSLLYVVKKS